MGFSPGAGDDFQLRKPRSEHHDPSPHSAKLVTSRSSHGLDASGRTRCSHKYPSRKRRARCTARRPFPAGNNSRRSRHNRSGLAFLCQVLEPSSATAPQERVAQERAKIARVGYLGQAPAASFAPRLPVRPAGERRRGSRLTWPHCDGRDGEGHQLPALSVFVGGLVICTLLWSRFAGEPRLRITRGARPLCS